MPATAPQDQQIIKKDETGWLYLLKRSVLLRILGVLTVSIILTMVFIAWTLKSSLISDNSAKTRELSNTIYSSLKGLMLARNPDMIQRTMENITKKNSSITNAFIIDRAGKVVYSSDRKEIGRVLDIYRDETCRGCHGKSGSAPASSSIVTSEKGTAIHRNVTVIYNEEACYGCHAKSAGITGKLIIDRSLESTYALIDRIEFILLAAGLLCVIVLIPFQSKLLSSGINKYIDEILRQVKELRLLYAMMKRLSKTIDIEELKPIIIDILQELLATDEIAVVLPEEGRRYRLTVWERQGDGSFRRKVENAGHSLRLIAEDWINGRLCEKAISDDRKQICMAMRKGDKDLSLIVARKTEGVFDVVTANFMEIMSAHIAVAFENALLYKAAITDELTTLYAYRYGGEEFAVILSSTDLQKGRQVAERVRQAVERAPFIFEALSLNITISVGVSTCPDNARSVRDLILTADKALYDAKHTGKNKIVVSSEKKSSATG